MQKKTRRRSVAVTAGLVAAFVGLLLGRAALSGAPSPTKAPLLDGLVVDQDTAAKNLAEYIRIDTSSPPGIPAEKDKVPPHVEFLLEKYVKPLGLEHKLIDDRILLARWRAQKAKGPPVVLLSHADVVPVAEEERAKWTHPPFSGDIADGFVWGRGTLDDKGSTICELEAIAALKKAGLGPKRDIIILVGADEETSGQGMASFVKDHIDLLDKPIGLIDEGAVIVPDNIPGKNLAAIAVAEKQYFTLKLEVDSEAGHSSMPKPTAATTVLARALGRLMTWQMPTKRLPPTELLLDRMSDNVSFGEKVLLRNRWLFGPIVERVLSQTPMANAMLRSTHALTMQRAGVKDNVIPAHAEAFVNFRLLPGDNREKVLEEVKRVMGEPAIKLTELQAETDTPIAPTDGPVWHGLESVLAATIPNAVVAPIISPATMDARHFARAGIPSYRMMPFTLDAAERQGIHGINERVSVDNIAQGVRVYAHLMVHL